MVKRSKTYPADSHVASGTNAERSSIGWSWRSFSFVIFAAAVIGLSACGPMFYTAASQNVPLIKHKGQTEVNMAGNQSQVAVHAAHGIGENIAVKVDAAAFLPREFMSDLFHSNHIFGTHGEVGVGYFTSMSDRWVLEVYAFTGYGLSKNRFYDPVEEENRLYVRLNAGHWDFGIQPNFGFTSKHFDIALSARMFYLRFTDIEGNLIYRGEYQRDYLRAHRSHFLAEPALTFRFGPGRFKYQIQVAYIENTIPNYSSDFHVLGTMGLTMSF